MENGNSRPKKGKTKKKLRLFRALTVVFALLFVGALVYAIVSANSNAKEIESLKRQIDGLRDTLTEKTNENIAFQSTVSSLSKQN